MSERNPLVKLPFICTEETFGEIKVSIVFEVSKMEIKEKIVSVAAELFMRYGVRSVSMDDVARELGMSKKTLYQSFSNKDEMINEVAKAHIQMEKDQFQDIEARSANAIEELNNMTSCMRDMMKGLNPSLLFDLQKYHPTAWNVFLEFKMNFLLGQLERNIQRGLDEGYYREGINAKVLATLRIEQVQLVFDPKIFPQSEYNLIEVQLQVLDHFIYGLLSDKGRVLYKECQQNQQSQLHA